MGIINKPMRAKVAWPVRRRLLLVRMVWTAALVVLPIVSFVLLVFSFQGPATRAGEQHLVFSLPPLAADLPARVNVAYLAERRSPYFEENIHLWWYATELTQLQSTARVGVYADGPGEGRDWACESDDSSIAGGESHNSYLFAYPERVPTEDLYYGNSPPHASAIIQVEPGSTQLYELETAGVRPSLTAPTPQPIPTRSPEPLPQIEVQIAVPDPDKTPAPPVVIPVAGPVTTQYEFWCTRRTSLDGFDPSKERIWVPEIVVIHDGFAASVDAEAVVYFPDEWSVVSPAPAGRGGSADVSTPGLVSFGYHRPLPPTTEIDSSSAMFGGRFDVLNSDAQNVTTFLQQMAFILLGAWIAALTGAAAPILSTNPWKRPPTVPPTVKYQ